MSKPMWIGRLIILPPVVPRLNRKTKDQSNDPVFSIFVISFSCSLRHEETQDETKAFLRD